MNLRACDNIVTAGDFNVDNYVTFICFSRQSCSSYLIDFNLDLFIENVKFTYERDGQVVA